MTLKQIVMIPVLTASLVFPFTAMAETSELGEPVVALMPQVKKLRADLNLNEEQNTTIDNWIAEAPKKRKLLEAETIEIKKQLREAILVGADRKTREELKAALAAKMTRLVEMRSLCTRMLRKTLNEEQFTKVIGAYRAEIGS